MIVVLSLVSRNVQFCGLTSISILIRMTFKLKLLYRMNQINLDLFISLVQSFFFSWTRIYFRNKQKKFGARSWRLKVIRLILVTVNGIRITDKRSFIRIHCLHLQCFQCLQTIISMKKVMSQLRFVQVCKRLIKYNSEWR